MSQLSLTSASVPGEERFYHGRLVRAGLPVPGVSWGSTAAPSTELEPCPAWLTAAEFSDPEPSLAVKVAALQELLLSSRQTVLYLGAGAATSAGLRQWARGSRGGESRADYRTTEAAPSVTHLTLASLVQVSHSKSLPPFTS